MLLLFLSFLMSNEGFSQFMVSYLSFRNRPYQHQNDAITLYDLDKYVYLIIYRFFHEISSFNAVQQKKFPNKNLSLPG